MPGRTALSIVHSTLARADELAHCRCRCTVTIRNALDHQVPPVGFEPTLGTLLGGQPLPLGYGGGVIVPTYHDFYDMPRINPINAIPVMRISHVGTESDYSAYVIYGK